MSCPEHIGKKALNASATSTSGAPLPTKSATSLQEAIQILTQTGQNFSFENISAALKKPQPAKNIQKQFEAAIQASISAGSVIATPKITGDGRKLMEYAKAPSAGKGGTVTAVSDLPMPTHQLGNTTKTSITSAKQESSAGYFYWSEFRKKKDHLNQPFDGRVLHLDGLDVDMGEKVDAGDKLQNVSCLRRGNPILVGRSSSVRVGHSVPYALNALVNGEVVETKDGLVELYDEGRKSLLAVYDPSANLDGDTTGTDYISPDQVAAYLAYRAMHPQDISDYGFITDLAAMSNGTGTACAAVDSANIIMQETDGKVKFGGTIGTKKCPQCGRFMGDSHACPVSNKEDQPAPAAAAPAVEPTQTLIAKAVEAENKVVEAQAQAVAAPAVEPGSEITQLMSQMTQMMGMLSQSQMALQNQMSVLQQNVAAPVQTITPPQPVVNPAKPVTRAPRAIHPPRKGDLTEQEKIFGQISLEIPDVYLTAIPESMGGNVNTPSFENIAEVDPDYYVNDETRTLMQMIAANIMSGKSAKGKTFWSRSFGLYGMPGTGKNELARQLAASVRTVDDDGNISQGIGVCEVTVEKNSVAEDFLGGTSIKNGNSTASLPDFAEAVARGSVVCVNEIVRNPQLATIFQQMIEDGYFKPTGVHGQPIKVHPSTIFVFTWNPGNEGDAERPALAPLRRMTALPMSRPSPEELQGRVHSFFAKMDSNLKPTDQEIGYACQFIYDVQSLAGSGVTRSIGRNSDTPPMPTASELNRFCLYGKTVGWKKALETLKIYVDQDENFNDQWKTVVESFNNAFGKKYTVPFEPRR